MFDLVDTHFHLSPELNFAEIFEKSVKQGVKKFIMAGTDLKNSEFLKSIANQFDDTYFSAGVCPSEIENYKIEDFQGIKKILTQKKCVAVGECGLDYHYLKDFKNKQIEVFDYQLNLAKFFKLPVIIHSRKAQEDTLNLLQKNKINRFVLHCFTEDKNFAKKLLNLGAYISFSGIITFKNAESLRETLKYIPLDRILIETDSPYLAPQSKRGQKNYPYYLPEIFSKICETKKIKPEILSKNLWDNTNNLFFNNKNLD
jgi:TatD DNase family protein